MFKTGFKPYACEDDSIRCEVDGFDVVARIERDDCSDAPDERSDGFWPSRDEKDAGYVLPENFDEQMAKATEAMRAWKADEWFYCGVVLTVSRADVDLGYASLWGVECNYPGSDNGYLLEVANELLSEAIADARAKIAALVTP